MKSVHIFLGIILTIVLLVVFGVEAQYQQGYNRNPYTGGYAQRQPAYNPYTGAGSARQQVNPFTRAPGRGSNPINPYTGKPMQQPMGYNAITGSVHRGQSAASRTRTQSSRWPGGQFPITGKAGPGLNAFDRVVLTMMNRHGIPGAALAIAKDGKLVYAKGFGWANLAGGTASQPLTVFGLASLSKPITALAILLLIERGQLRLEDRVFDILKGIKPPPGARVDPRLRKITIRHLLNHSGGWDRRKSGDPAVQEPVIARALAKIPPISDDDFVSFMMGEPLNFEPGTQMQYSNVGYILLGKVVAKVSGQRYEAFVQKNVLQLAGIRRAFTNSEPRSYKEGEARRYLAGTSILLPPMELPMVRAAGGWCTSAVDMVRFLTALDGSRGKALLKEKTFKQMLSLPPPPLRRRANGSHNGLGWPSVYLTAKGFSYVHDGSFHGMRTFMKRSDEGINWVLLFNVSMNPDQIDANVIRQGIQEVRQRVEGIERYPDINLFEQFR